MFSRLFDDSPEWTRGQVVGLYVLLLLFNAVAWLWAVVEFHDLPALLGLAFLAYSFGLRHAFDADHIAAIDNVTRKLMQEGRQPLGVGLFFSLGHATVVVAMTIVVVLTATALQSRFGAFKDIGGFIGTSVSVLFLFTIAAVNVLVLIDVCRAFVRATSGDHCSKGDHLHGGVLARLLRPAFGLIVRSWHMYPLGLLFGLGFDTATEVGLLGISATQASQGLSCWSLLVFPALFAAGMSLMDTVDSTLMVGAYGWAFVSPVRKLYYNMTITFVSVLAALVIGGVEALGLIGDKLGLRGAFWNVISALGDNFGALGYAIVAFFIASWVVSFLIYKAKGYDRLHFTSATGSDGLTTSTFATIPVRVIGARSRATS
jgi:nickel/cobalt transporter (NiCoT) family protein